MVIADPFGSWVQGAHEGQSDAIAMRNAQDETAQRNYALQRESTFDPQQYRMLHNAADTSDLELGQNRKIYGDDIPYKSAQAGLENKQLGNTQVAAGMGDVYPYIQHQIDTGGQFTPEGIQHPITDYHGNQTYYQTPYGNLSAANRFHYGMQAAYQQARIEAQSQGRELREEEFEQMHGLPRGSLGGTGSYPASVPGAGGATNMGGDIFGGKFSTPPAAKVVAPSVTPAGTPTQGISLKPNVASVNDPSANPYGLAAVPGANSNRIKRVA